MFVSPTETLLYLILPMIDPSSSMETETATPEKLAPPNKSPKFADLQLTVQYQRGLEIIGVGAAGQVYSVDDHIVLKACRIYERPSNNVSPGVLWDYASETVLQFGLSRDGKAVLRLLMKQPPPNIIGVIHTDHPKGIYFRKYRPLGGNVVKSHDDRLLLYQDVMRWSSHLHRLGVAHSDIRKDNLLLDEEGHALLADFGATCPFGYGNSSLPALLNGPSEAVSGATDRFAMDSLMYELEFHNPP